MRFCRSTFSAAVRGGVLAAAVCAGTAACSHAAAPAHPQGVDVKAIDTRISPCQDFYQYACGRWNATHPIPADQAMWSTFQELAERNRVELRQILERAQAQAQNEDQLARQVGGYYAACMNRSAVAQAGLRPLQPALDAIAGLRRKRELAAEVARLQVDGVDALFSFGSDQDYKNAKAEIAEADQGGFALPDRDYYLKPDRKSAALRTKYAAHVTRIMRLLGDSPAQARAEAGTVMAIETALARAALSKEARRHPQNIYHKMSAAQLERLSPAFDWQAYFQAAGAPRFTALNVTEPGFFRALNRELQRRPLGQWKTYLRWELAHFAAPDLSPPFVNANFAFFGATLTGQKVLQARWKRCVRSTDGHLGEALGKLYVEKYFTPAAKAHMQAMVRHLEASLGADIQDLSWMSAATKKQALVKLHAVVNQIGYPEHWRDYSSIVISRDRFFTDVRRTNAFEWHRQLNKIGKPVDRRDWVMTPPTVNAYYNPEWNQIVFPAGILQPPFYNAQRDLATNYGGAGVIIGHELTHGFDDQGRQFDAQGNMRDWWTPADAQAFQQRAACLVQEYGGFSPLPGVKLNGKLTLGENTADNGGARIAYMAMEKALSAQPRELIDGFSREQRFFLGFGQVFCENVRPKMQRLLATVDPHSPGRFRVNGVVANLPEFAQAFHCGPSEPMTAGGKACRVW